MLPQTDQTRWFSEHVQPHEPVLRSYLQGSFPQVRDVDDVVQESYLRVWRAHAAEPVRFAKAFLFTVARRLALDFIRSERRSPLVAGAELASLFVADAALPADAAAARAEENRLLVEAVEALPRRCREIFILRKLHGVSQREIAERLGLSEQTVQVQAARGLRKCGEFMRARLDSP